MFFFPIPSHVRRAATTVEHTHTHTHSALISMDGATLVEFSPVDLKFKRDFRILCSGPSGSGKTTFVLNILRHRTETFGGQDFDHVFWCVSDLSSVPENLAKVVPNVKIERGLAFLPKIPTNSLCIFDDVISKIYDSEAFLDLAVRRSSHSRISYILLSQNLFFPSRYARTINLSMTYLCLFQFLRDASTYETLCRQIGCRNYRDLHNALTSHLNERPFNCFIIDSHQTTPSFLRFRSIRFLTEKEAEEENCGNRVQHTVFLTESALDRLCSSGGSGNSSIAALLRNE